eukprot:412048-Hanusia_phi.AAC.5
MRREGGEDGMKRSGSKGIEANNSWESDTDKMSQLGVSCGRRLVECQILTELLQFSWPSMSLEPRRSRWGDA